MEYFNEKHPSNGSLVDKEELIDILNMTIKGLESHIWDCKHNIKKCQIKIAELVCEEKTNIVAKDLLK